jgi:hypothetical protein
MLSCYDPTQEDEVAEEWLDKRDSGKDPVS